MRVLSLVIVLAYFVSDASLLAAAENFGVQYQWRDFARLAFCQWAAGCAEGLSQDVCHRLAARPVVANCHSAFPNSLCQIMFTSLRFVEYLTGP